MGRVCLLWAMVLPALIALPAHATEPPGDLMEAETSFRQQEYRHTVGILKPLLYPSPTLGSVDSVQRARELLGASHWHLDEMAEARQEWQFLLIARPGIALDSLVYPKPLRDYFDQLREELIRQGVISRAQAHTPQGDQPPTVLRVTQYVETRSRALTFVPFGVPQFEYGEDGWGTFFATSQGLTALASIGSYVALYALQLNTPYVAEGSSDQALQQTMMWTALGTGVAFFALATWGVIDANARHEPTRIVRVTRTIESHETADTGPPQPIRVVPLPAAGGSPQ